MAFTNRRILPQTTVAVAHEATLDTAPATSEAINLFCSSVEVNPESQYVDVNGTAGSFHRKTTYFKTATVPTAILTMPCTKKNLLFFGEHAMHGQPQALQSDATITIANDGGSALASGLTLNGIRPHHNTDDLWKLYVTVTDENPGAGQALVEIFKDAARLNLVASGSAADLGVVTLTEQNSSGLSGSVTIGTVAATDSDIELTIVSVALKRSATIDRGFTIWRDSGQEMERITGCTVKRLVRRSSEFEAVMLEVELQGITYTRELATTFTPSLTADDRDIYLHDAVAYTSDVDSDAVVESVFSVEVELVNDLAVDVFNAAKPTAIWKRIVDSLKVTIEQRWADEAGVFVTEGLADNFTAERVVDTHATKAATWNFDQAKVIDPKQPGMDDLEWGRAVHVLESREETAASPAEPYTLTVQGP